ncbi:MAG: MarR family transcriptional regulator [Actinobacteria bacterium]|nr:MarR family transcriptional regulator [Actinomycetota bacterium]
MGTVQTETEASSGTTGRWLTPDEQDAWRAFLATSKLLFRQLDRDLQPFGLSINDYEILVVLSESPDHRLRMTDLADATAQSRSRLSHQITRMEAAGLVRRDTCPGDKRGLFTVLTDTGMATIERVAPEHVDSVRRHFINLLTPDQLAALREGYAAVTTHLRQIRERD